MEDYSEFQEEEFSATLNGQTVLRILAQLKPHWRWVVGFLFMITLVSALDSYFTYLNKEIIDRGVGGRDLTIIFNIMVQYGALLLVQAAGGCSFSDLSG